MDKVVSPRDVKRMMATIRRLEKVDISAALKKMEDMLDFSDATSFDIYLNIRISLLAFDVYQRIGNQEFALSRLEEARVAINSIYRKKSILAYLYFRWKIQAKSKRLR